MSRSGSRPNSGNRYTISDGSIDTEALRETARPVLTTWQYDVALAGVRRRLQGILGAGLLVIAIELLLSPGGITGTLISLWFWLSLPMVALVGCLLVLLRDPAAGIDSFQDNGILATAGLVSLVGLIHASRFNPYGRVLWELLFGGEHPDDDSYEFGGDNAPVDLSGVARIRRYVWFAIVGSAAIILIEQVVRNDVFGSGVFEGVLGTDPGPLEWVLLGLALLVGGIILGAFAAAIDR